MEADLLSALQLESLESLMLAQLDPRALFSGSPESIPQGGIGIALGFSKAAKEPRFYTVAQVAPDGPAAASQIEVGDLIHEVDGRAVAGMRVKDVQGCILGPAGSTVILKAQRPGPDGAHYSVTLQRKRTSTASELPEAETTGTPFSGLGTYFGSASVTPQLMRPSFLVDFANPFTARVADSGANGTNVSRRNSQVHDLPSAPSAPAPDVSTKQEQQHEVPASPVRVLIERWDHKLKPSPRPDVLTPVAPIAPKTAAASRGEDFDHAGTRATTPGMTCQVRIEPGSDAKTLEVADAAAGGASAAQNVATAGRANVSKSAFCAPAGLVSRAVETTWHLSDLPSATARTAPFPAQGTRSPLHTATAAPTQSLSTKACAGYSQLYCDQVQQEDARGDFKIGGYVVQGYAKSPRNRSTASTNRGNFSLPGAHHAPHPVWFSKILAVRPGDNQLSQLTARSASPAAAHDCRGLVDESGRLLQPIRQAEAPPPDPCSDIQSMDAYQHLMRVIQETEAHVTTSRTTSRHLSARMP